VITDLAALLASQGDQTYRAFLDAPALSLGLFAAPAGHVDTQTPHERDEVYVVLTGAAVLEVDGERTPVAAGSVAYVPARVPHRFVDITEDVRVVVVFAPGG
jgi:mannose-6-phosphate isomerase-like protein (cupin superfamily)